MFLVTIPMDSCLMVWSSVLEPISLDFKKSFLVFHRILELIPVSISRHFSLLKPATAMLVSLVCKSQNALLLAHSKTCIHHKNYAMNLKRPSNRPAGNSVDRAVGVCKPERKKGQEAEVLKGQEVGATEKNSGAGKKKCLGNRRRGCGLFAAKFDPLPLSSGIF